MALRRTARALDGFAFEPWDRRVPELNLHVDNRFAFESRLVLHGTLVGVAAALIYVALTRAQPEPVPYIVAHVLKLVGGACGGWFAARRREGATVAAV